MYFFHQVPVASNVPMASMEILQEKLRAMLHVVNNVNVITMSIPMPLVIVTGLLANV